MTVALPRPLVEVPHPGFRGLNLSASPSVTGPDEALDCLNVVFTERGSLRQRDGYAKFTAAETTNQPDSMSSFYSATAGFSQIVVGNGSVVTALNTGSGAVVASLTGMSTSPHYFARLGSTGTAEHLYISNGVDAVRRWDGSTFTAPAGLGSQTGRFVAVQSPDSRLVVARPSGDPSRVDFSNAGDPETFSSDDQVWLDPGDGEEIMGMTTWRDLLYVFKQTKFYVFTGNSTDNTGGTVFNYRGVATGIGLAASRALAVAPEGVYFLDRHGVYLTSGIGTPEKVSGPVDPIFAGAPNIFFRSSPLNTAFTTSCAMTIFDGRLYLAYPSGGSTVNDRMLVMDKSQGWSLFDIGASCLSKVRVGNVDELMFGFAAGDNHVGRYKDRGAYSADNMSTTGTGGTAITARWRSGWFDYGSRDVKTIRESKLWGSGHVQFTLTPDFQDTTEAQMEDITFTSVADTWGDGTGVDLWGDGTSASDLWGPAGSITPWLSRMSMRGAAFSMGFQNTTINTTFAVQNVVNHLRETRQPATLTTD